MSNLVQGKKKVVKTIQLLTDPKPQFVSLVDHGANQTPFTVVKSDSLPENEVAVAGVRTAETETQSDEGSMSKKAQAKQKVVRTADESGAALHALVFKGEGFDSEESVRTFLDEAGYEGGTIESVDGGYQVVARDAGEFEGDIQSIEDEATGVTRLVGVVKKTDGEPGDGEGEESEGGEDQSDTEESDDSTVSEFSESEAVKKYDSWRAEWSDEQSIREVMSEGSDGLPPGIHELNSAFYTALRNRILAGDLDGITTITTEFGNMIRDLVKVWDFATLPAELVQKAMGEPAEQEVAKKSDSEEPDPEKELDFNEAQMSDLVQRVAQALTDGGMVATPDNLKLVAKSVKQLSDKLDENVENFSKQLNETQESVTKASEANTTLSETVKKQAAQIEELEGLPLGSRSLDHDLMSENTVTTQKKSEGGVSLDSMLRNELGLG